MSKFKVGDKVWVKPYEFNAEIVDIEYHSQYSNIYDVEVACDSVITFTEDELEPAHESESIKVLFESSDEVLQFPTNASEKELQEHFQKTAEPTIPLSQVKEMMWEAYWAGIVECHTEDEIVDESEYRKQYNKWFNYKYPENGKDN